MIALGGFAAFLLATLVIGLFHLSQARGQFVEDCGGYWNAVGLFVAYFTVLSSLFSPVAVAFIIAKELPAVKRRLPSALFSLGLLPLVALGVSALSIPIFAGVRAPMHEWAGKGFHMHELIGEIGIVLGAGFGFGLADYLWDRRRLRARAGLEVR
jgi:hypothetical protein